MSTLGIALSSDPQKTWTCEIDWSASPPALLGLHCVGDDPDPRPGVPSNRFGAPRQVRDEPSLTMALAERILAFDPSPDRLAGIAAPFGWPDEFVSSVAAWASGTRDAFEKRPEQRQRAADRFVHATAGISPGNLITGALGGTAMLCAETLARVTKARGGTLDLARGTDGIVEVSAAAAPRMWTTADGTVLAQAHRRIKAGLRSHDARSAMLEFLIGMLDARALLGLRDDGSPIYGRAFDAYDDVDAYGPYGGYGSARSDRLGHDRYDGPASVQHPMLGAAGVTTSDGQRRSLERSDGALDAFFAALVTRAVQLGHCFVPDVQVEKHEIAPSLRGGEKAEDRFVRMARARAAQEEAWSVAGAEGWTYVPRAGRLRAALGLDEPERAKIDAAWIEAQTGRAPAVPDADDPRFGDESRHVAGRA